MSRRRGRGACLYCTYLIGPNEFAKGLSKRQVMLKITHERPKSPTAELELEAAIEVLRWDDRMYQTSATLQLRSALTPMRLLCPVTVDAADFHVTQTAPPDLPSHPPPAGDLHCGPPERPLHPGVKSSFPQQRRAQPRPHSGVPPTESFCESANASLTKQPVGVFNFYTRWSRFQVCSALIHPFGSDTVPSDSEICLTFTSNQVKIHLQSPI